MTSEQKAWTPGQPLRADATDQQIAMRGAYLSPVVLSVIAGGWMARLAREFAAASVEAVGKPTCEDTLPVYVPDPFKEHVVRVISEAMGELKMVRDGSAGSMFEQFAAHAIWLRTLIGDPPEGSHPEEWLPRHATWHGERANWIGEVEHLRAHIKRLGSIVPADGAPSRAAVQSSLMDAIEKGFLSAEVQYKSDIPTEFIAIDYAGIVGKIMESLYAMIPRELTTWEHDSKVQEAYNDCVASLTFRKGTRIPLLDALCKSVAACYTHKPETRNEED